MDLGLRHLLVRWTRSSAGEHQTDYQGLVDVPATLEGEYQRLVADQLARWCIPEGVVSIEVGKHEARRRKPAMSVELAVQRWDRDAALRVLIGLPLLERRIRKALATLWVADVSTFEGLKVKVSPALLESGPCSELRQLLASVTSRAQSGREAL